MQSQNTVSAHFKIKQILPFGFAEQHYCLIYTILSYDCKVKTDVTLFSVIERKMRQDLIIQFVLILCLFIDTKLCSCCIIYCIYLSQSHVHLYISQLYIHSNKYTCSPIWLICQNSEHNYKYDLDEVAKLRKNERIGLEITFVHIQAKLGQENLLKMLRWVTWHCPTDTGFEIQTLEVWERARYLSVMEASQNTEF